LLVTLLFILTIGFLCHRNPGLAPAGEYTNWLSKIKSLSKLTETIILFLFAIGGLFLGWFSPTQAGGIGAAGALIIGIVRRNLSWEAFWSATKDSVRMTCMVFFIVAGALIFGHFMVVSQIPVSLANWVEGLQVPPIVTMGMILCLYFLGGLFMDMLALIVLTIPIIFPVVARIGFDPIWFAIAINLAACIGVITPPVGLHVFVLKGIAPDVSIETIFKGSFPFVAALIVAIIIIIIFPQLATFLPNLAYG